MEICFRLRGIADRGWGIALGRSAHPGARDPGILCRHTSRGVERNPQRENQDGDRPGSKLSERGSAHGTEKDLLRHPARPNPRGRLRSSEQVSQNGKESFHARRFSASGKRGKRGKMVAADETRPVSIRKIGPDLVFGRFWKSMGFEEIVRGLAGAAMGSIWSGRFISRGISPLPPATIPQPIPSRGSPRARHAWLGRAYLPQRSRRRTDTVLPITIMPEWSMRP